MTLRPYQNQALTEIRGQFRYSKKVLLHLATGGGKTVIFCQVLKGVLDKGMRAIMVVRGRKLVDQASNRLYREGVYHGVMMANHWNYRPHERIQVCSIDTLISRKVAPPADLVVIDEAHLFTSDISKQFFALYPKAFFLPVTATPYTDQPLNHLADRAVHPVTIGDLIDQGFLVRPRYFAPNIPDLTGVHTQNGDYKKDQLQNVMMGGTLVGDVITHWKNIAQNRPTLVFAVSIAHSQALVRSFNEQGIPAAHCDADSSDSERNDIIKRLESGELKVISNVGIFCTGVDIPALSCVVFARPTKSYILYIQQAGRGTRPFGGKSDFIILDHAGNVLRHGFIENEREAILDGKEKRSERSESPATCPVCFAVFEATKTVCPACGADLGGSSKPRKFEVIDGNLKELAPDADIINFIREKKRIAKENGYKRGWVYWRLVDKFGEAVAEQYMPKPQIPQWMKTGG